MKTRRDYLNDYTDAAREIELAGCCISILEGMRGSAATRCIKAMQQEQQRALKRLDAAAVALGAPYPAKKRDG